MEKNVSSDKQTAFFEKFNRTLFTVRKDGKRDRSYLLWAFLLPFTVMLLLYVRDGVYPFGTNSVLVLDLNGQYVGFYEALRAFVYGNGSLLYSFARSLGGEMMGIYAYYIASPFSYIVALFPEGNITEALFFIFILKAGCCGLTFGIYLHAKQYAKPVETVLFSCLYALTSYAIVMQHNSMWIDNLILLPLVTLGIEQVVKYRRFRLFVLSLALALLSNFYIGYMTCIYVLLYFFYYFYAYNGDGQNNPLHEKNHYFRSLLRMGLYSAFAIGMAAIIILTVSYSLSFGKNSFSEPNYTPTIRFDPLSFFAKMLPNSYDTVEPEGLPFVYCGILTLLLLPLYFLNRRFRRGERIASFVFLLVFYVSMSVSSLDMLWHGGQAPNWLNYRYSFFLCFILLVLATRAFARISDVTERQILSVAVVLCAMIALAGAMQYRNFSLTAMAVSLLLVAALTMLLLCLRRRGEIARPFFSSLALLVVIAELFYNGTWQLYCLHADVGSTTRESYVKYHETTGTAVSFIKGMDDSFYRMETTDHRVTNDVMELGYRGVTNSTSTLNTATLRFLNRMGLLATSHWSEYKGSTMTLDSLLGIRYIITPTYHCPQDGYVSVYDDENHSVYRTPYALSLAYAAREAVRTCDITSPTLHPLERQNLWVAAMTGSDRPLYLPLKAQAEFDHVRYELMELGSDKVLYYELLSDVYMENKEKIEAGEIDAGDLFAPESGLTFDITVEHDGILYFYIPTEYPNDVTVYVNGEYYGSLDGSDLDYVKSLGYRETGDELHVTVRMEKCSFFYYPVDSVCFYQEDAEAVTESMRALTAGNFRITSYTEDAFTGTLTAGEGQTVVQTTIPYDAGWQIHVDGTPVTPYMTLDALLAFDIAEGEHTIEMVYRPTCYVRGKCISLLSLALFLLLVLIEELWRRGILHPANESALSRFLSLFFCRECIPAEPNYLSDEWLLSRAPKEKPHTETKGNDESDTTGAKGDEEYADTEEQVGDAEDSATTQDGTEPPSGEA